MSSSPAKESIAEMEITPEIEITSPNSSCTEINTSNETLLSSDSPEKQQQQPNIQIKNVVSLAPNDATTKIASVEHRTVDKTGLEKEGEGTSTSKNALQAKEHLTGIMSEESLQQLSTNTLPSYSPISFPSSLGTDTAPKMHACNDCGDSFVSSESLKFHLQRRSVLIKFACSSCPNPQVFYNRCCLLSHVRGHADKNESSDIKNARVMPLPRVLTDALVSDLLKTIQDEPLDFNTRYKEIPTSCNVLEASMLVNEEAKEARNLEHYPEPSALSRSKRIKCTECSVEFESYKERRDHFTNGNKIPVMISLCCKCGILCPTECSLKAHKRLHLQISPYVCPECGDNPDRYWENFQKHLKYQCFHYARSIGYKCDLCNILLHSSDSLKKHMMLDHTQTLVKCRTCPMAFINPASFNAHRKNNHGSSETKFNLLYKCSLCDIVFLSKEQIVTHLMSHVKDNTSLYTFTCMECHRPQDNKIGLRLHLKKSHPKVYNQFATYICAPEEVTRNNSNNKLDLGFNKSRIECLLCHGSFLTHQGYSIHCAKSHSNYKFPCGVCSNPSINRREMICHGKQHLLNGISLCLLCHNKSLKGSETLDVHLLYHVERIKFQTCCPICESPLYNFEEALQHLRTEHMLSTTNLPDFKKRIADKQKPPVNRGKKRFKESSPEPPDSDRPTLNEVDHATLDSKPSDSNPKCNSNQEKKNVNEQLAKQKQTKVSDGGCAKCAFKSDNRAEFKEHILTHKESRTSFQCQECGMCFVVKPSLQKHLKIVHKIMDTDQYINDEGTNYSPEKIVHQSVTKANALECTVCFEAFASDTLLKTHMRSHGMAFIRRVSGY